MSQSLNTTLAGKLSRRKEENAFRELTLTGDLIDFCSNDYLGFARNASLQELARQLTPEDPYRLNGSTGSRLIRGNTTFAEELEQEIAQYHSAEAALLFNSGYDANLGFFSAVPQRGDTIFYDRLIHASIRDGIRLSTAQSRAFRHNDVDDLRRQLAEAKGTVFVAVESVYSMDGDMAPLVELAGLCREEGLHLVVDEAHAIGVFGEKGEGLVTDPEACYARIYTYGKAMGCHGAAIAGSSLLSDYLVNFCRSFIYTTALPPSSHAAIRAAYQLLGNARQEREQLQRLITQFTNWKQAHPELGFTNSPSAVQCIIVPGNGQVRRLAAEIREQGFDVRAVLSPTVPVGEERIRICLHAFNTQEELKILLHTTSP